MLVNFQCFRHLNSFGELPGGVFDAMTTLSLQILWIYFMALWPLLSGSEWLFMPETLKIDKVITSNNVS